jgi:hypothetical protein
MRRIYYITIINIILICSFGCLAQNWIESESKTADDSHKGFSSNSITLAKDDGGDRGEDHSRERPNTAKSPVESEETPLKIKKYFLPGSVDGFSRDNEFSVLVEVINLKQEIKNLNIVERIDDSFNITDSPISCYVVYNITKASLLVNKLKRLNTYELLYGIDYDDSVGIQIDETEKLIYFHLDRIGPKGRAIYIYNVKPNKEGPFSIGTYVDMDGYPPVDYDLSDTCFSQKLISVRVLPPNKYQLDTGTEMEIRYSINYTSKSTDPNYLPINIKFKKSSKEYILKLNQKDINSTISENNEFLFYNTSLNNSEPHYIVLIIKFLSANEYPIPPIYVNSGSAWDVHSFDGAHLIDVEDPKDIIDFIYKWLPLILALAALFLTWHEIRSTKKELNSLLSPVNDALLSNSREINTLGVTLEEINKKIK